MFWEISERMHARVRTGFGIGAVLGAVGAAGSFFFALPIAKFGIFNRLEIVVVGLFLSGAMCAACMSAVDGKRGAIRRATGSPVALMLAGLAVWSSAVAPWTEYPWRSFLGPPQTGQGILALAALAAVAGTVAAFGADRRVRIALAAASAGGAVVAALTHVGPSALRPFEVPGYFVLLGLAASAALATLPLDRRRRYLLAGAVIAVTMAISENRTAAIVILALGVPAVWSADRAIVLGNAGLVRRVATTAAIALPFAVSLGVWIAGEAGLGASIVARARIYDVLAAAFADRPQALIFGFGWGGVIEAFFRHLPSGAELLYGDSWDVPVRDFHSAHNLALEFFVSAGLPGLAVAVALPATVIRFAPRRNLAAAVGFSISLAALSVVWHQQSFNLGPTVVGCALLLSRPCSLSRGQIRGTRAGFRLVAGLAAAGLFFGAIWLSDYGVRARRSLAQAGSAECLDGFPADPARGDMGLRYALYGATSSLRGAGDAPDMYRRAAAISCEVDRRFAASPSLHLALAVSLYRSEFVFDPNIGGGRPISEESVRIWSKSVEALLALAPRRTDLAVPYLAWLAQTGKLTELSTVTEAILHDSPYDAVGLWFSGLALIESSVPTERRSGAARMLSAVDRHFGRILPVTEETLRQIQSIRDGKL